MGDELSPEYHWPLLHRVRCTKSIEDLSFADAFHEVEGLFDLIVGEPEGLARPFHTDAVWAVRSVLTFVAVT
jgi:hypothetical protein